MDELLQCDWLLIEGADFAVRFERAVRSRSLRLESEVSYAILNVATGDVTCVIAGDSAGALFARHVYVLEGIGNHDATDAPVKSLAALAMVFNRSIRGV